MLWERAAFNEQHGIFLPTGCCYLSNSIKALEDTPSTHTHTCLTALFPGLPGWAGTRKVKLIWILLKQETVCGSGISWAICKSAPRSRQITTPAPHHSVFYRLDALPAAQPTASRHWRQRYSKHWHKLFILALRVHSVFNTLEERDIIQSCWLCIWKMHMKMISSGSIIATADIVYGAGSMEQLSVRLSHHLTADATASGFAAEHCVGRRYHTGHQCCRQVSHTATDGGPRTSANHCWMPSIRCARPRGLELSAGRPPRTAGLRVL